MVAKAAIRIIHETADNLFRELFIFIEKRKKNLDLNISNLSAAKKYLQSECCVQNTVIGVTSETKSKVFLIDIILEYSMTCFTINNISLVILLVILPFIQISSFVELKIAAQTVYLEQSTHVGRAGVRFDTGASGISSSMKSIWLRFKKYGLPTGPIVAGIFHSSTSPGYQVLTYLLAISSTLSKIS